MALQTLDLWNLVRKRPQIDPRDLADAIREQVRATSLDYRTRLLVRDGIEALRSYWGSTRLEQWLAHCLEQERIQSICDEDFDKIGFPSLRSRLMEKTEPDDILQFFAYLGKKVRQTTRNVALSKLFSARLKDLEDLRVLKPQLDKEVLTARFRSSAHDFLAAPRLKQLAQDNWQVLFGEPLPQ